MGQINKRKIALAMLFSILTLGIYGIYWHYLLVKNCREVTGDKTKCTGEMLAIVFVPFYRHYWWYKNGELSKASFEKAGYTAAGNGLVYLLLCLFGLSVVAMAIMQNDFNSLPAAGNTGNRKLVFCLTETAVMVSLATVLSMVKVFALPLGGSVTLLSMLPIAVIAISLGTGWGLAGAFLYSVIQFIFGIAFDGLLGWGLDIVQLTECIILDYLIAYTVLGLAGIFRKNKYSPLIGTALALTLRFVSHFLSGYIIFANFDKFIVFGQTFSGKPFLYSLLYNGSYMLPELILTCFAVFILISVNFFERIKRL